MNKSDPSEFWHAEVRSAYYDLVSHLAFLKLRAELRAFGDLLEEKYRPDQPRAPKGTPEGGQWVVDSGSARQRRVGDGRVRVAQVRESSFYAIDLEQEDKKGGHGYRDHVGKTRGDLLKILEEIHYKLRLPNGQIVYRHHEAEGTFFSAGEANYWVSTALAAHPEIVEKVVQGKVGTEPTEVLHRFGNQIGVEAYRESYFSSVVFRPTYWVTVWLVKDPSKRSRGYRVVSAYPMNDVQNEEVRPLQ